MTSAKLQARPEFDYSQLVKEMSRLELADRLLVNRRGNLPSFLPANANCRFAYLDRQRQPRQVSHINGFALTVRIREAKSWHRSQLRRPAEA